MADARRGAWNALISAIADPALRQLAERLASSVSEDSWLRSEFAERLLAGLKGLAEGYKGSGVSGVAVEKATDFLDFASGDLFGKGGKGSAVGAARGWLNRFMKDAEKALREAPKDKLGEVQAKLQQEFSIRKEIVRMVEEAEKEALPPKKDAKPVDWKKAARGVKSFTRRIRKYRRSQSWLRPRRVR